MSTLTETRTATLPRVNLLPPEIEEARRFQRVQIGLGAGVLAAAGVVGALLLMANGQVNSAQQELEASQARQAALQTESATYAEVPILLAQVESAESQLQGAMGNEVRWSYFLNDLSLVTPGKVWLTEVTVTQNVDQVGSAAAAAPGTLAAPGIGTVSVKGHGMTHNDVAAWLDALAKQKGLTQPYVTSSALDTIGTTETASFESQAVITEDAMSKRFTQKAGS